jgi:GH15 family glucan-1,4-alpha-glucosidase
VTPSTAGSPARRRKEPLQRLDHLEGYARSRPARIGNEAFDQHQLEIYGQVLDAAFAYHEVTRDLSGEHLAELWRIVDALCDQWREPDHNIWEPPPRLLAPPGEHERGNHLERRHEERPLWRAQPDGTLLGNYPQAVTHLGLISAALNLDEAGRRDALHAWADRHQD